MTLPLILAGVIAFGITMYVLLDGFDLGVGILFSFVRNEPDRDLMMHSVAPIWDGNETWLVLGGAVLFGAFPAAYAALLPALYLPIIIMLIALIFRGVAFEFRFKSERRWIWNLSFTLGSTLAAFCQGLILGAYIQGFRYANGQYIGGTFEWLSAFSIMTGVAVVCAYALLGACWLVIKTEGALHETMRSTALKLLWVVLGFIMMVSIWTPLSQSAISQRWFSWPNFLYLSPIPLLTALTAAGLYYTLRGDRDHGPFVLCVMLYVLTLGGLAISLWPYIVPRAYSLWEMASPQASLEFVLVGVAVTVPVILIYTAHAYYVFRGKVTHTQGYH